MSPLSEQKKLLRWHLLGATSAEEDELIEHRYQSQKGLEEELLLAEEELIEEYLLGALPAYEKDLFVENFLTTPEKLQKMEITGAAIRYAATQPTAAIDESSGSMETPIPSKEADTASDDRSTTERRGKERQPKPFFFLNSMWRAAAFGVLLFIAGAVFWSYWRRGTDRSELSAAQTALDRAYQRQRSLETRITDFKYAPFPKTMGNGDAKIDYIALERAERVLLDEIARRPGPAVQHALGRLYLAEKKFDKAAKLFNAALEKDPENARLHSDVGAMLYEKWELLRASGNSAESETLKQQSLDHLSRSLALDHALSEARFNLAIYYQRTGQSQLAREQWRQYLIEDPASPWAEEARRSLSLLK